MRSLILPLAVLAACSSNPSQPDAGNTVTPSSIDPQKSTITVSPSRPIVADMADTATITVNVVGTDGKPVHPITVDLTVSGASGNDGGVYFQSVQSNDGSAVFAYSSGVADLKTLTASVETVPPVQLAAMPTVQFIAGPAAGIAFVVQPPATAKAGQIISPPIVLRTFDNNGNPSNDPPLTASLRLVYSNNGTLTGGQAKTSVDGGLVFDMLTVDAPQTGYALRAEVNTGPGSGAAAESTRFDVVQGDASAATSTLIATPVNVVADGTSTTTLTVTLEDQGANPLSGLPVVLSVSGSGNTLGADGGVTDATGTFSTTLSSTVAEAKTVTATSGTLHLTAPVTFIP